MENNNGEETDMKIDVRREMNIIDTLVPASEIKAGIKEKPKLYSFERRNQSLPLINESLNYDNQLENNYGSSLKKEKLSVSSFVNQEDNSL